MLANKKDLKPDTKTKKLPTEIICTPVTHISMADIIEKMFLGWQAAFSFTVYIRLLLSLVSKTFCFLLPINITLYSDQQYIFKCSFCFFYSIKKKKDFNANDGEWQNWTYLLSKSTIQFIGCQLGWFGQNLETFLFVMIERMGADISWIETRDDAKYHTVCRTALLLNQKWSDPKCQESQGRETLV